MLKLRVCVLFLLTLTLLQGCSVIRSDRFPLEGKGGVFSVDYLSGYLPAVSDLPEGWVQIEDTVAATNEKLAANQGDPESYLSKLNSLGRAGGVYRHFVLPGVLVGTNEIDVSIIVLESAQSARDYVDLTHQRDVLGVESGDYVAVSDASAPAFGEYGDAYFVVSSSEENTPAKTWYQISFAINNAAIFVRSISSNASGDIQDALLVSGIVEERMTP